MNLSSLAWLLERVNRGTGWLLPSIFGFMTFGFLVAQFVSERCLDAAFGLALLLGGGALVALSVRWWRHRSGWSEKRRQSLSDSLLRELAKMPSVTVIRSERTDPGGISRPRYR